MAKSDPLNGKLVVIAGGSGFLGNYVAQALLERGARLRIASRHPEEAFSLKPLANLGQIQFARCDIKNERSAEAVVHGADAVVNMVGSFDGDLIELMGRSAGQLAAAAKQAGVTSFVQVSAIGADAESAAEYAQAKAIGEQLVLEAFPSATILRPSIIFGKDDNFLNMFAGLIQFMPVLPVFAPEAKLQLVYVDDVAEAVAETLAHPGKHGGKTYELGGPEQLTMMEINRRISAAQGRERTFIPMPDMVSGIFAALPLTPMGTDQWRLLKQGNVVGEKALGFKQLGIEPKPLSLFLDRWMVQYRKHGRFAMASKN
ncbi:complex I NDUFA9 subunit family protein [Pontixanthobacter gangjinensis]|uniref:SDR family NAD(P)-dependent oxidoreductase n=2 Tax=Pontixanthobacter gangjinensis TaxID=1028742 RepID=A0A6I4SJP1_9SPHN|nr:SDR family NAD(P)-dependent oxidoreductase [Pontixanthobacter gangjinensis]